MQFCVIEKHRSKNLNVDKEKTAHNIDITAEENNNKTSKMEAKQQSEAKQGEKQLENDQISDESTFNDEQIDLKSIKPVEMESIRAKLSPKDAEELKKMIDEKVLHLKKAKSKDKIF